MSPFHQQTVSSAQAAADPVLHAIDYQDVALSPEGAKLIHHGARQVVREHMPAADHEELTPSQAVALFVDKVFWEENSGGLIMCTMVGDRSLCLPIPKAHWTVRDGLTVQ